MPDFDCVVCGSCVADLLVRPFPLEAALGRSRTIVVEPIEATVGGLVANAGIAMARLGMRVAALGMVGDDAFGEMFRRRLEGEGISTHALTTTANAPTTTAIVLIDRRGERSFAFHPGATAAVDRKLLLDHLELFARSRWALLGYYSLLPRLEGNLPDVLQKIRSTGCRTALDSAGDGGHLEPLDRALVHLDAYVPSRAEAAHQTGRSDPQAMLQAYRDCGARGLLGVKLGEHGALLSPEPGRLVEIEAIEPPEGVVDTTGAGDAFYAGLLAGLLAGLDTEAAGRLAAATAACCISARGATAGLRSCRETARLAGLVL